jgi:ubiquinone/menaquinone biosynthesis C-methylase UbiE
LGNTTKVKIVRPSLVSYPDYVGMLNLYYSKNPFVRHYFWRRFSKLLSLIEWDEANLILELGFGPGVLFPTLVNLSNTVIGLDAQTRKHSSIVNGMLENERIKSKVSLLDGDACVLPFRDGVFDVVIAADVLEHIPKIADALSEIKRVSRSGASLLVSAPIESRLRNIMRRTLGYDLPLDYHTHSVIEEAIDHLFNLIKIDRYPSFPPGFLLIAARK